MLAEDLGDPDARLPGVRQPPVGQVERDALVDAQELCGPGGLFGADFGAAVGRGLAGQLR